MQKNLLIAIGIILVGIIGYIVWIQYSEPEPVVTPPTHIRVVDDPGNLPQVYSDPNDHFSLRYPSQYSVDMGYIYQVLGPGKGIQGVKFTIDPSIATGTNLASDSYVSFEQKPDAAVCDATQFLGNDVHVITTIEKGVVYSVASTSEAGAGNRYDETLYAYLNSKPCLAMRYFVHYSAVENFPAGAVKSFDRESLFSQFDAIRHTVTVKNTTDSSTTVPGVQGKLNIQAVCAGALSYMSFTDGTAADAFVAACIEGKHPEVIERFLKDRGLDGAAL